MALKDAAVKKKLTSCYYITFYLNLTIKVLQKINNLVDQYGAISSSDMENIVLQCMSYFEQGVRVLFCRM